MEVKAEQMQTINLKKIKDYWFPVRWGLKTRGVLLGFSSSYGGKFMRIRRPLSVFLNTLLDDKHQETFEGTAHQIYNEQRTRKEV